MPARGGDRTGESAPGDELALRALAAHGGVADVTSVFQNELAFLNGVWHVQTAAGPLVLKRHSKWVTRARLAWTGDFLSRLSQGFACDTIVRTPSGETCVDADGELFTVHTHLRGVSPRGGMPALSESGRHSVVTAMATYHAAVARLRLSPPPPLARRSSSIGQLPDELDPTTLLYSPTLSYDIGTVIRRLDGLLEVDDALVSRVVELLHLFARAEIFRTLPQLVAHGDLRPKNILFVGGRFSGLCDWDLVQCATRLVDVCGRAAQYHLDLAVASGDAGPMREYLRLYEAAARTAGQPVIEPERHAFWFLLLDGVIRTELIVAAALTSAPLQGAEGPRERRAEIVKRASNGLNHLAAIEAVAAAV